MISSYPTSYASGPRHLRPDVEGPPSFMPPYQSGTPEEEEELALLQRLEQQMLEQHEVGAPSQPSEEDDDEADDPPQAEDDDAVDWPPAGQEPHERPPAKDEPPPHSWHPSMDEGDAEEPEGKMPTQSRLPPPPTAEQEMDEAHELAVENALPPSRASLPPPRTEVPPRLAPEHSVEKEPAAPDRATWFRQQAVAAEDEPPSFGNSHLPAEKDNIRLMSDRAYQSSKNARVGGPALAAPPPGQQAPKIAAQPVKLAVPPAAPGQPPGKVPGAVAQENGGPAGLERSTGTTPEREQHVAHLNKVKEGDSEVERLQIPPPQSQADLEPLRQEEIRMSPTSAAQARLLDQLCEMMDYKIKWELNPKKESTASYNSPDPANKVITIYMSQARQGGGTFGHESEHAIKYLLQEMLLAEKPGIRTKERRREIEKLLTDPVYAYPKVENPGPKSANSDLEDDPSDVSETVPLRIGNVITAERILNMLAESRGLDHGQRLDLFKPEQVRNVEAIKNNFLTEHPNLTSPFPQGTEIGRNQFERLREDWKKKAEKQGRSKP